MATEQVVTTHVPIPHHNASDLLRRADVDRLHIYGYMLRRADEVEKATIESEKKGYVTIVGLGDGTHVTDKFLTFSLILADRIRSMAQGVYESDFAHIPVLRSIADEIKETVYGSPVQEC